MVTDISGSTPNFTSIRTRDGDVAISDGGSRVSVGYGVRVLAWYEGCGMVPYLPNLAAMVLWYNTIHTIGGLEDPG
eukprot:scaffold3034_cov173-Amphora_coffeaeformis.AAC.13